MLETGNSASKLSPNQLLISRWFCFNDATASRCCFRWPQTYPATFSRTVGRTNPQDFSDIITSRRAGISVIWPDSDDNGTSSPLSCSLRLGSCRIEVRTQLLSPLKLVGVSFQLCRIKVWVPKGGMCLAETIELRSSKGNGNWEHQVS